MNLIKECVEKGKKEQMLTWLYDEDRWPSGAAGGFVTKDEQYRARYLLFTRDALRPGNDDGGAQYRRLKRPGGPDQENGRLLACYRRSR